MGLVGTYRRLLVVVFFAGASVLVGPAAQWSPRGAVHVLPRAATDMADHLKEANAVFTGTVEAIAGASTTVPPTSRTSTVLVDRVYTGDMITHRDRRGGHPRGVRQLHPRPRAGRAVHLLRGVRRGLHRDRLRRHDGSRSRLS